MTRKTTLTRSMIRHAIKTLRKSDEKFFNIDDECYIKMIKNVSLTSKVLFVVNKKK